MSIENSPSAIVEAVRADRERIFQELSEVVAFNSVHGDPELADQTAGSAAWVAARLEGLGLSVEEIDAADGSHALVATRPAAEGRPTVLLYCHHDVVPAGPRENWESDPFTLTERDGRWYGRGAADCKGNIAMHLAALRAAFAADEDLGGTGITVVVEGSEEQGGEGLEDLIDKRPELFTADAILIADTGNFAAGVPTLTTTLRGGAQLVVRVDTMAAPVHSGLFGGAAPDAVFALARTLDSLRDEDGNTVIDGVDTAQEWPGHPYPAEDFRRDAGVLDGVALAGGPDVKPADLVWARPSIAVTGLTSTPVDKAVNAVPATAQAKLNLRVPPELDPADVAGKVAEHLKNHAAYGARVTVDVVETNPGFAADPQAPAIATLKEALADAYGEEEAVEQGSGGSIPLTASLSAAHPDASIALFGVEEPTCLIHSANESVSPDEIERVAAAEALFLLRYRG